MVGDWITSRIVSRLHMRTVVQRQAQAKKAIEAVTAARSNAVNLKVESSKRIKSITDAVGNTASFSYDGNGRISAITDPSSPNGGNYNKTSSVKHTYQYTNGNLTNIRYSNGKTASYKYDGSRNLTQMCDHAGYNVNFSYNGRNRITQVSEMGRGNTSGQKYTITYHSDNTSEFRFSGANDVEHLWFSCFRRCYRKKHQKALYWAEQCIL